MERERRCPRCRISPRMDPQWVCEDCGHRDDLDLDALLASADRAERLEAELWQARALIQREFDGEGSGDSEYRAVLAQIDAALRGGEG